jgi:segregation and condensation protein A
MESAAVMAEELRAHLLEYKLAKELASYLRQREEAGLQTHGRSGLLAGIEAQLAWTPPTLVGLDPQSLAQAFQKLLARHVREEANGEGLIPQARVRVSERIAIIMNLLRTRSNVLLTELIENEHSRLVIVVTFLAVLEIWKRARICVRQDGNFGPILLERGEHWEEDGQWEKLDEQ